MATANYSTPPTSNDAPAPDDLYNQPVRIPETGPGFTETLPDGTPPVNPVPDTNVGTTPVTSGGANIVDDMTLRAQTGALPEGGVQVAEATPITQDQLISTESGKLTTGYDAVTGNGGAITTQAVAATGSFVAFDNFDSAVESLQESELARIREAMASDEYTEEDRRNAEQAIIRGIENLRGIEPEKQQLWLDEYNRQRMEESTMQARTVLADTSQEQVKAATENLTAATREFTDDAKVTAAEGALSEAAKAVGAEFADEYLRLVPEDVKRAVASGELPVAALAEYIPMSQEQISNFESKVQAAKFASDTPEAIAQTAYTLTPTEYATQQATAVNQAATIAADKIPSAEAQQSTYESAISAVQGQVGANEIVDPQKILAATKAVEATAATLEALNTEAVAIAAQGTFSQAAVAKAIVGTVPPSATVQGQMENLMMQFNDGTPAWAAGAMRAATAAMAARGLAGSSMAGAAIVQAAMESAMPIAQQDANAFATMNMANVDRQQQVALANAASQANMELANLSNRQQTALQNSTNAFALQSQNLSNAQAVVLANAQFKAALQDKTIDVNTSTALTNAARYAEQNNINLNNAQQAMLAKSAENLQVDMTELSNAQQTALSNLQVRAAMMGQNLSNEQQVAMLESTQAFERAGFDANAQQQAFIQDAQARAAMEGRVLDNKQQTALFNVSNIMQERGIELNNEQQTRIFNSTQNLQIETANLSNRQQTALANAQIEAAMRGQELSNKQQVNIVTAERYAEAANMTFTAQQQNTLANSQLMSTIGLAEMNNVQAATLQNAANLANMDMANLSNMQQAAVINAQQFLQLDMANMSNEQQMEIFKTQNVVQSLLTDMAATNAAKQFNASSEMQVEQFVSTLRTQVSQFNATQQNAMAQFNETNDLDLAKFNADMNNQREQFNAQNELVINQSNATWRRQVATADTAAINAANQANAQSVLAISTQAYNNLWNTMNDQMEWAWKSGESALDRAANLTIQEMSSQATIMAAELAADREASKSIGEGIFSWLSDGGVSGALSDLETGWNTVKSWFGSKP